MEFTFDPAMHIVNLGGRVSEQMSDGGGGILEGVLGLSGATGQIENGSQIGIDLITMQAGSRFGLHTHLGAHILMVRDGRGFITVDGVDYKISGGDTVYIPAKYPHAVSAAADSEVCFFAVGVPHMPVASPHRMALVELPIET
jgi:quercetin dioxygenase-like cupin family protein